ncbi:MAG TPA: peptide chain release factor N(5)-glutamine methyltransferase [Clostridia bacterium]|nr:peptide chain release factor N(5)-glutamine methyltransferase [Clostridia bacterium]
MKDKKKTVQIAGQAVIEGVMMQGVSSRALAVRDEAGNIRIESERLKPKSKIRKIPFIRGIVNLVLSLFSGTKVLMKSAEAAAEEVDTTNGKGLNAMLFMSVLLGFGLAIGLFVLLPTAITEWIFNINNKMLKLVIDAGIKVIIMVGYFAAISRMKDIRRIFMYHGAEHKTISCFEQGKELTVENVRPCTRQHDRCGTSFIVYVIIISIILMLLTGLIAQASGFNAYFDKIWVRSLIKLALLPFTAAISYEILMLFAGKNFWLIRPLKWLGKQMQKITVREPDDDMIEVAIAAHKAVQKMDADAQMAETHFPAPVTLGEFKKSVEPLLNYKTIESSDVDWILCSVLGVKRNQLNDKISVPFGYGVRIEKMLERCAKGEPLQYVLGNTEFCGNLFKVNEGVLIPRMETELVCEEVTKQIGDKRRKVLDLCCGSGCIGISVALKTKCYITCSDISPEAIKLTKKNADYYKLSINIVKGDMLAPFNSKFDIIVCNPPYIKTDVIETLDKKVKDHEPRLALDGGKDGLEYYRYLAKNAPKRLYDGGKLILEIGYDQADEVRQILENNFVVEEIKKDYGGNDRIVVATVK